MNPNIFPGIVAIINLIIVVIILVLIVKYLLKKKNEKTIYLKLFIDNFIFN